MFYEHLLSLLLSNDILSVSLVLKRFLLCATHQITLLQLEWENEWNSRFVEFSLIHTKPSSSIFFLTNKAGIEKRLLEYLIKPDFNISYTKFSIIFFWE